MEAVDLNHIILEEVPVCPICGDPIHILDDCDIATYNSVLFLVHFECSDVEYCNA